MIETMLTSKALLRPTIKNSFALMLLFGTGSAIAQETLCVIKVSGTENAVNIKTTQDPYVLNTMNLESGFRFSGQVLQDAVTKQHKLKTFVYHEAKNRYVLIQASEHKLDIANCTDAKNMTQEFGLQRVYSHEYEFELSYRCRSTCTAGVTQ
jgi:hypothetical protein